MAAALSLAAAAWLSPRPSARWRRPPALSCCSPPRRPPLLWRLAARRRPPRSGGVCRGGTLACRWWSVLLLAPFPADPPPSWRTAPCSLAAPSPKDGFPGVAPCRGALFPLLLNSSLAVAPPCAGGAAHVAAPLPGGSGCHDERAGGRMHPVIAMGGRPVVQSLGESSGGTTGGEGGRWEGGQQRGLGDGGDSRRCGDGECGAGGEKLGKKKKKKRRKQEPSAGVNATDLTSIQRYLLASS